MDEVYQTLSLNKLENILDFIVSYTIYTKQHKAELSLDNFVRDFVNITVADVYPEWIDYVSMTTIPETSVFNFSLNIRCQGWWENCYKTEKKAKRLFKLVLNFNQVEGRL